MNIAPGPIEKQRYPQRTHLEKQSFFLASPGDVRAERRELVLRLRSELQSEGYDIFAWEYDAAITFQTGATYQDLIPYPSDRLAPVTICLLGEKLGSGVGDDFKLPAGFEQWLAGWQKSLGSPICLPSVTPGRGGNKIPLTGTLFELLDAIRAADSDQGRAVWLFVKGKPNTLPSTGWKRRSTLDQIPLSRQFGLNAFFKQLTDIAAEGSPQSTEAQEYLDKHRTDQLSYVDAVLRILRQKSLHVEWFDSTQDLIDKVGRLTKGYFKARTPSAAAPWTPSLDAIDSAHSQSLFGRKAEVVQICDQLIKLSLPENPGRPWYVLPGVSGSGKSSIARAGVAAKFRAGFRNGCEVVTIETTPNSLRTGTSRPPVLELARRIRESLGNPAFSGKHDQAAWDRCIDAGEQASPAEVARLVLSLLPAPPGGEHTRFVLLVFDQAEEWWDASGLFAAENRPMLVFLDHLTRSKVVWCLTVLQSEPADRGLGGKLQSLRQLAEFDQSTVEIAKPLAPPGSTDRIRDIVFGVVREQIGAAPPGLEALVQSADKLLDTHFPFLPLLALRLKRICDAFREQAPGKSADAPGDAGSGATAAAGTDDPFSQIRPAAAVLTVEPWMTESLLGELDGLGELALAHLPAALRDSGGIGPAFDLSLSKLIGVIPAQAAGGGATKPPRSERCIPCECERDEFGAPDTTERMLVESLIRHRLVRHAGRKLRLAHISIVDHWRTAQDWFDTTEQRREAMERVSILLAPHNKEPAIAANLEAPDNWKPVSEVLHHIARPSALVPEQIIKRRPELISAAAKAFAASTDVAIRNQRLNQALESGFDELASAMLSIPCVMLALDSDASEHGADSLLIRLARVGALELLVRAAKEGCRRTAKSPRSGETVFSVLLQRLEHEPQALGVLHVLLDGDADDRIDGAPRPTPLKGADRASIQSRTGPGKHSLLDIAALSGSAQAVRFALHLNSENEERRKLIDPLREKSTRTQPSPLLLAVQANKPAAIQALLAEASRLDGQEGLERYVNSMPARAEVRQRREPAIVAAVRTGNRALVDMLLAHGADPTKADTSQCDAFQAALLLDDTQILTVLQATRRATAPTHLGLHLSHWAAILNAKACLLMLARVHLGTPPRDALGRTPLLVACARSRPDIVKALIESLPRRERARQLSLFDNRGRNALTTALSAQRTDVAELILEQDSVAASLNKPDPGGYRPLHYAVRFCGVEGVSLLRGKGAETDFALEHPAQITPLQVAAMIDDAAACELLMTEHSIGQLSPHKRTALHYAARHNSLGALRKLLEHPAAPIQARNAEGQTALHLAAFHGHAGCVQALLEANGAKDFVDAADTRPEGTQRGGRTALWSASSADRPEAIRLLLNAGADPEHRAADHLRPIDVACRRGAASAVAALLESGASIEPGWLNHTPLHYACLGGHHACFEALAAWIQDRQGPNALPAAMAARTQVGETPLQVLSKALVRANRPAALGRDQEEEGSFGGEGEMSDPPAPGADRTQEQPEEIEGPENEPDARKPVFDLQGAAAIIKRGLPLLADAPDQDTMNDLAIGCAMFGDLEVIAACRKAGGRFDTVRDRFGATPLHVAAKAGRTEAFPALIDAGVEVNARAADGTHALHNLVLHGSAAQLEQGLKLFAKDPSDLPAVVNAADVFGETALHKIAACKSSELVEKLTVICGAGADLNRPNAEGETPRGVLAFVRKKIGSTDRDDLKAEADILDEAMAKRGGRIEERGKKAARLPRVAFPLHSSVEAAQWDLVPLIQHHASGYTLVAPDPKGRIPLMALAAADWSDGQDGKIGKFFDWLCAQSDPDARDATGRSLAHYACLATVQNGAKPVGTDTVLARLPPSADLSLRDGVGRAPLHIAAAVGNEAAIHWLVAKGQSVSQEDELGNTALHLATQGGHDNAFKALLKYAPEELEKQNAAGLTPAQIRSRKGQIAPEVWSAWESKAVLQAAAAPLAPARRRVATIFAVVAATAILAAAGAVLLGYLDLEALSGGFSGR